MTAPDADRRAEPDWQGLTNLKKPAKDRVFRGPTGRVTVALKKAVGVGAILELLRDAVRMLEAELAGQGGDAQAA